MRVSRTVLREAREFVQNVADQPANLIGAEPVRVIVAQ